MDEPFEGPDLLHLGFLRQGEDDALEALSAKGDPDAAPGPDREVGGNAVAERPPPRAGGVHGDVGVGHAVVEGALLLGAACL